MNKHKAKKIMNKFNLIDKTGSIINCNDYKYYDDNDNDNDNNNNNEKFFLLIYKNELLLV